MSLLYRAAFTLAAVTAALAAGCSDDGGSDGLGPEPTPDLAITLLPHRLTVPQAWYATASIMIARGTSDVGAVQLAATGVPAGVTVAITPAEVAPPKTEATVRVDVAADVPIARHSFTIEARAAGVTTARATMWVDVVAPRPGAIRIEIPNGASLLPGGTDTAFVYIQRVAPFTGEVALAAERIPPGVNVRFEPSPTVENVARVIVSAMTDAPYGYYNVRVIGSGAGIQDVQATMSVAILDPDPPRIAIVVQPSALTIPAGGSGTAIVNILRFGGFTNGVDFWLSEWPTGFDVTFTPAENVLGRTAELRVEVGAGMLPGEYPVVVWGIEAGPPNVYTDIMALDTLLVTVPPGS